MIMASATPSSLGTRAKHLSTLAPQERIVRGIRRHAEGPQVADAVIKAKVNGVNSPGVFQQKKGGVGMIPNPPLCSKIVQVLLSLGVAGPNQPLETYLRLSCSPDFAYAVHSSRDFWGVVY